MNGFYFILAGFMNLVWVCMQRELSFWIQILVPVVTVVLLGMGTVVSLPGLSRARARRRIRGVLWVILLYYLAIISVMLFFGGLFHLDREWGGAVNLEPLHTIRNFLIHYRRTGSLASLFNLLGNIAILVPLGVLLPLLFPALRHFWIYFPLAALVAGGIEYIQWYTATGVADVDDSILNFIGAAGGYILTRMCQMIYFALEKRKKRE